MCLYCGRVVATSVQKDKLTIAESAHICEATPKAMAAIASACQKQP